MTDPSAEWTPVGDEYCLRSIPLTVTRSLNFGFVQFILPRPFPFQYFREPARTHEWSWWTYTTLQYNAIEPSSLAWLSKNCGHRVRSPAGCEITQVSQIQLVIEDSAQNDTALTEPWIVDSVYCIFAYLRWAERSSIPLLWKFHIFWVCIVSWVASRDKQNTTVRALGRA